MDKQKQRGWVLIVSGIVIFLFTTIYSLAIGEFNNGKFLPPIYVSVAMFWIGYFLIVDSKEVRPPEKENMIMRAVIGWVVLPLTILCFITAGTSHHAYLDSIALMHYLMIMTLGIAIPGLTAILKYEDF